MTSSELLTILNSNGSSTINLIDIGCHQGAFLRTLQQTITKPIYAIGVDAIDHGVGSNYNTFVNKAIDNVDEPTTKVFHLYNESGCNSLLELNKELLTQDQSEYDSKWYVGGRDIEWHYTEQGRLDVPVDSMFNILKGLNYNQAIDLVKIDTQGNDVNVLLSFREYISSIKYLQIESVYTHNKDITLYKNQPIFEDDDKIIRELGFELLNILDWSVNRDQCPEADVIYYNTKFKNA